MVAEVRLEAGHLKECFSITALTVADDIEIVSLRQGADRFIGSGIELRRESPQIVHLQLAETVNEAVALR